MKVKDLLDRFEKEKMYSMTIDTYNKDFRWFAFEDWLKLKEVILNEV